MLFGRGLHQVGGRNVGPSGFVGKFKRIVSGGDLPVRKCNLYSAQYLKIGHHGLLLNGHLLAGTVVALAVRVTEIFAELLPVI